MNSNTVLVLALCYLLSFTWVAQYAEAAHIEKLAALALILRALSGGNKGGHGVKFIPVYIGGHHEKKPKKKEQEIKIIHVGGGHHGGGMEMMESMGHMGGSMGGEEEMSSGGHGWW